MKKPVLTLKNLVTNEKLSEETVCFSAKLYVDGTLTAEVANRGCGGCHETYWLKSAKISETDLNNLVKATFPKWTSQYMEGENETDLEMAISVIVDNVSEIKRFRRGMKNKVYTLEGGKIIVRSWKGVKAITEKHIQAIATQHPTAEVLNTVSDDRLLEVIEADRAKQ